MLSFEEFFRKKKINLLILSQAESDLFAEFKTHYEQMGEKSFDHTKKYWFNKLRLKYPAPAEVKTEKVKIENQLAEQTITETLAEDASTNAPKAGFKPSFKATIAKPVMEESAAAESASTPPQPELSIGLADKTDDLPVPKVGFKPRFKIPVQNPTLEEREKIVELSAEEPVIEIPAPPSSSTDITTEATEQAASKPAYKPRFKMQQIKSKPDKDR